MKKAIVLGIMAMFALSMSVYAQENETKDEKAGKGATPVVTTNEQTPIVKGAAVKANPDVVKKTEAAAFSKKNQTEAAEAKTAKPAGVQKDTKANMGDATPTKSDNTAPKGTTVERVSKNAMGEVTNTKAADNTAPKTSVKKGSKNDMGAIATPKSAGQPKFGTETVEHKLSLKPRTIKEPKGGSTTSDKPKTKR